MNTVRIQDCKGRLTPCKIVFYILYKTISTPWSRFHKDTNVGTIYIWSQKEKPDNNVPWKQIVLLNKNEQHVVGLNKHSYVIRFKLNDKLVRSQIGTEKSKITARRLYKE